MKLNIYIQSPLFNNSKKDTELYKNNIINLFALDKVDNGLIVENIKDETIEVLIKEHTKEIEPKNYSEELLPFDGGMFIKVGDKYIDSNCCGDVSNIENWRILFTANNAFWEALWIGHPEIAYKFDEKNIYLSNYIGATKEIETKFQFDKKEFLQLLETKIKLFDSFKEQTYKVIDDSKLENYMALKKVLF
jgi:hypothetical protein